MESALNVFGVVGALLLTLVIVLPTTLSYDEMRAANARFSNTTPGVDYTKYALFWKDHTLGGNLTICDAFTRLASISVSLLSCCILLVVLVYFNVVFGKMARAHACCL